MSDIRLERSFGVSPERLFAAVTSQADLLQWWGPEGLHVPEHALDLSQTGPWYSVMVNEEGQRFKVSGQVTSIDPPKSVGFTWAWHDDEDTRGPESHVTFSIVAMEEGARLIVDHRALGDDEVAQNHEMGWGSSLNKLETLIK
ncbi:SRPBCC domain-containing protein [Shimia sp.]|uniref:SRPBCC family protein n=1 Tax=Shimia sp. TaxID=1954381 RepID=UPI003299B0F6